ncbi:hypothetical protein ABZ318_13100 [Streptomyces sp. NPDC006197]|uniref:hypothetical protein n=1 Tax=Streptomyces sp. NPDC006197 TaxID=3156685 RepID=UPI0033A0CA7B
MTFDARRSRRLQHVTATGTALAVALGPLVLGALFAKSVGGDPMVSVNALIAGGGQRARISRAQLRSGVRLRPAARTRPGTRLRSRGAVARPGSVVRPARQEEGLRRLLPGVRLPHEAGRLDRTSRGQQARETVG